MINCSGHALTRLGRALEPMLYLNMSKLPFAHLLAFHATPNSK